MYYDVLKGSWPGGTVAKTVGGGRVIVVGDGCWLSGSALLLFVLEAVDYQSELACTLIVEMPGALQVRVSAMAWLKGCRVGPQMAVMFHFLAEAKWILEMGMHRQMNWPHSLFVKTVKDKRFHQDMRKPNSGSLGSVLGGVCRGWVE